MSSPGCSGTPLVHKIGVKPGHRLALDQAPTGWTIPALPGDVILGAADEPSDVIVAFFREAADLGAMNAAQRPRHTNLRAAVT